MAEGPCSMDSSLELVDASAHACLLAKLAELLRLDTFVSCRFLKSAEAVPEWCSECVHLLLAHSRQVATSEQVRLV